MQPCGFDSSNLSGPIGAALRPFQAVLAARLGNAVLYTCLPNLSLSCGTRSAGPELDGKV